MAILTLDGPAGAEKREAFASHDPEHVTSPVPHCIIQAKS